MMLKQKTKFKPVVFTRHPSHEAFKNRMQTMPFRSVIRLGSTTTLDAYNSRRKTRLNLAQMSRITEINTVDGVKNSSDKLKMKMCFAQAGVKTAEWWTSVDGINFKPSNIKDPIKSSELDFPIIVKHRFGSRGNGNTLLANKQELKEWCVNKTLDNYIFEKYYTYVREYRLHVTKNGCFYACRKMLKKDTPEDKRFQRHDDNCVWYMENNPDFDKPVNWISITNDCIRALKALKLDVAGFDIKVQSSKDKDGALRDSPEWILIESNSACSHGDMTTEKYLEEIPKILNDKRKELMNKIYYV